MNLWRTSFSALFLGLCLATAACSKPSGGQVNAVQATLVDAPDGDTVHVRTPEKALLKVRVAGIDTPERGQAYWRVARAKLIELTRGKPLVLDCFKTDQYERSVCRVQADGQDVAAQLVESGMAWHYKRFQSEQTPAERELYARLETAARASRKGLWQDEDPMPPEVCRKERRAGNPCR